MEEELRGTISGETNQKQSIVGKELTEMEAAIKILIERTGELEENLKPILRKVEPLEKRDKEDQPSVPLAAVIRESKEKIEMVNEIIENITNRVEL